MKIIDNNANAKNKVWTIEHNAIVSHKVIVGMTDGTNTQILSGIPAGLKVITGLSISSEAEATPQANAGGESSPFAPGPPGKNKKK